MDAELVDQAVRALSRSTTRRRGLVAVLGAVLGAAFPAIETDARRRRKPSRGKQQESLRARNIAKKKKRKKKNTKNTSIVPTTSPLPSPPMRGARTLTFANVAPVSIPVKGQASAYPSTIQVSGFRNGAITDVSVHLLGFSHRFPGDIDILLAASHIPGQNAIIMSDSGTNTTSSFNLSLDDQAESALPRNSGIVSGTFQPTNFDAGIDSFPAPAPSPTGNSQLSTFNGQNPNGTWQLFVVDDANGDAGSLAFGWTLEITAVVDL